MKIYIILKPLHPLLYFHHHYLVQLPMLDPSHSAKIEITLQIKNIKPPDVLPNPQAPLINHLAELD